MVGAITWHRNLGRVVIDLHSPMWREYLAEAQTSAEAAAEHVERASTAGRLRRLKRGLYVIAEEARPADTVAIASQIFDPQPNYVTTDGALRHHGITEQPVMTYRVVVPSDTRRLRTGIRIDHLTIRPVNIARARLEASAFASTLTAASNRAEIAEPEQALADGLAYPRWMDLFDLLPEFLANIGARRLERTVDRTIERSQAAAQRLGFALDQIGIPVPERLARVPHAKGVQYDPRRPSTSFSTRWSIWASQA